MSFLQDNYLYILLVVLIIIVAIIIIMTYVKSSSTSSTEDLAPEDFKTHLTNNLGGTFILTTPANALSLTYQGINITDPTLLNSNSFTFIESPSSLILKSDSLTDDSDFAVNYIYTIHQDLQDFGLNDYIFITTSVSKNTGDNFGTLFYDTLI